jgi:6-phosphogluconate dehydrogenase (decarboxylating)
MYVGEGGSGNFVKMVHNGIEYGDMQVMRVEATRDYTKQDPFHTHVKHGGVRCVEG